MLIAHMKKPKLVVSTIWNPATKGTGMTLSGSNLIATAGTSGPFSVRASVGKNSGKWYWELVPNAANNCQIGISDSSADLNAYADSTHSNVYYGANGAFYGAGGAYGPTWTTGAVVGVAFDGDSGKLFFSKNGTFTGDPVAGTGAAKTGLTGGTSWFPCVFIGVGDTNSVGVTANFGNTSFVYTAPTGYTAGIY